jgi:hypothetical protein
MHNSQKIEDCVLALLGAFAFDGGRTWKRYEFSVMEVLCEKGYISDPRGKAESVTLSPEGLARARELARQLFSD